MAEVQRFFGDPVAGKKLAAHETCFGRGLLRSGLSAEAVERFATNPDLTIDNRRASAFEFTEEMDAK